MPRDKGSSHLNRLILGDRLHSALMESAVTRVLRKHEYSESVNFFIHQIRKTPWIIDALSSMAMMRWRFRWSTPDAFADSIVLVRSYLEISSFFAEGISEEVRMGFSVFLMDVAVERAGRPSPGAGVSN